MKTTPFRRGYAGFTVSELLCVIAIIGILAALVLPALSQAKARAKRIQCVEQLHQTGLAFITFAHDHNGKFPMAVGASEGGSLDSAQSANQAGGDFISPYRHFRALADELRTPRVLTCPSDSRRAAANFVTLSNENVSYFVGLNAEWSQPNSILAGDRNLTNDFTGPGGVARVGPNASLRWTRELHSYKGNLLFADGRVEENNSPRLAIGNGQTLTAQLALPVPPGSPPTPPSPPGQPSRPSAPSNPNPGNASPGPNVPPVGNVLIPLGKPTDDLANGSKGEPWVPVSTRITEPRQAGNSVPPDSVPTQSGTAPSPKASPSPTNASAWLLKERPADPGFSLFPEPVTMIPRALVKRSTWPLWLLLALILGVLLTRLKWMGNKRE